MRLQIDCQDRLGIARDILTLLVEHEIDLRGIEIQQEGHIYLNFPTIAFDEFSHLMPKIRKIPGIDDVKTVSFLPMEREHQQLSTFIHSLTKPVFTLDTKGRVLLINNAALAVLEMELEQVQGKDIGHWIDDFNFSHWLNQTEACSHSCQLKFVKQLFNADVFSVYVEENEGDKVLAGAVMMLTATPLITNIEHSAGSGSRQFDGYISESLKVVLDKLELAAPHKHSVLITGEQGTGKQTLANYYCQCVGYNKRYEFDLNLQHAQQLAHHIDILRSEPKQPSLLVVYHIEKASLALQMQLSSLADMQQITIIAVSELSLIELLQRSYVENFYYQISQLQVALSPLVEMPEQLVQLAEYFLKVFSRSPLTLSSSAVEVIQQYHWPGNLDQLKSVMSQAALNHSASDITRDQLSLLSYDREAGYCDTQFEGSLEQAVKNYEASILRRLYPAYPSSRALGRKLQISHTAIANKLREYKIGKTR